MGDVAMTVPVIRALIDQNPGLKVSVLTRDKFAPLFQSLSEVTVIGVDLKRQYRGLLGLFRLSKQIRKLEIDEVVDLHNVLRTNILKLLLPGMSFCQLDKGRKEKKALIKGDIFYQLKTTHQRYADVFRKLGLVTDLDNPSFPQPKTLDISTVFPDLKEEKITIGIAPFAAHRSKMYPLPLMEELIAELSSDYQLILFGGGEEEVSVLESIEKQFGNVRSVAGKLTLEEELALIASLDLMISMDSGNGHLAAIYGKNVLTLWGVTHPYAGFAPFNQPEDYALLADRTQYPLIPTSVYGNTYPESYLDAAGSIPVKAIVDKVRSIVGPS